MLPILEHDCSRGLGHDIGYKEALQQQLKLGHQVMAKWALDICAGNAK